MGNYVMIRGRKISRKHLSHGHCGAHGKKTPEYYTWEKMKERCYNPRSVRYAYYGGRGIKVCKRWHQFTNFLEDMGKRPRGRTLDRIDVNGHYAPANCRWATPVQQNNNQQKIDKKHWPFCTPGGVVVCGCGVDGRPCRLHPEHTDLPF